VVTSVRDRWAPLFSQAERQYGLLTRRQLLSRLTRHEILWRTRSGLLEPAGHGIWRIAGAPRTWRQRVLANCLAIGPPVAASHHTAGRLWGFEALADDGQIHLSVPTNRSGRRGVGWRVHRVVLPPSDVTERFGIPVTTAIRTLADLVPVIPVEALSRCTDQSLRERLMTPADLSSRLAQQYRRAGAPVLRGLAERRSGGVGDSEWEDRVYGWLVGAGLPAPVRQHQVELPTGSIRLDLAYPSRLVGIEFDGWAYHGGRQRFDADRIRASELALAGWTVVWVTSAQHQDEVVERVRRALQAGAC
jgi:hypothetical protein